MIKKLWSKLFRPRVAKTPELSDTTLTLKVKSLREAASKFVLDTRRLTRHSVHEVKTIGPYLRALRLLLNKTNDLYVVVYPTNHRGAPGCSSPYDAYNNALLTTPSNRKERGQHWKGRLYETEFNGVTVRLVLEDHHRAGRFSAHDDYWLYLVIAKEYVYTTGMRWDEDERYPEALQTVQTKLPMDLAGTILLNYFTQLAERLHGDVELMVGEAIRHDQVIRDQYKATAQRFQM